MMKKEPTVLITNATNRTDYSEAKAFGKLAVLSEKLYSFVPNSPANAILSKDLAKALDSFDPDVDFVLPSGSAVSTGLLFVGLYCRGIHSVRVLMWNGNDQIYHAGVLDLGIVNGVKNV